MIYPGMKIKIPSSTITVPNQGQSYKEQPIKEQPVKEQPIKELPIKEQAWMQQPVKEQPTHIKEEMMQVVEQTQIKTYPTNIHQDIYQIDLVTVVNEQEQPKPQPKPIKKPEAKPPVKPKPVEIPPINEKAEQEGACDTVIIQPVQQEVTCQTQTMQAQIPQEMSCNMMIQPQIPCMPYPFLIPCMPMPAQNCWPMYPTMMPQPGTASAYGTVNSYMPSQVQGVSGPDCGCAINQQTMTTEQAAYGMGAAMPVQQMNPSMMQMGTATPANVTGQSMSMPSATPNMYGGWQGQNMMPYVAAAMQNQGIPSPYIPMTTRNAEA